MAFERLDNCARWQREEKRIVRAARERRKKWKHNFFIHIIISSPFPLRLVKSRAGERRKKRDHHKNSYKLFKLNKKATISAFSSSHSARPVASNTRGLFIVVYGIAQATDCDATHVFTQKPKWMEEEKEKRRTEQTPCSMLMTIHVKTQTVGNYQPKHSQEMNSWIKDGARPGEKQLLDECTLSTLAHFYQASIGGREKCEVWAMTLAVGWGVEIYFAKLTRKLWGGLGSIGSLQNI